MKLHGAKQKGLKTGAFGSFGFALRAKYSLWFRPFQL
jgi:hypothetical protein